MPNYDYQCEKCGDIFEVFQSMNDRKLTKCPDQACGGPVNRLLGTGAGIIFKGSGFYGTDYRSDSYKAGEKAEKNSAKEKKDKSTGKKKDGAKKSGASKPKAD
jgi:putative FmdB family regulatory protein